MGLDLANKDFYLTNVKVLYEFKKYPKNITIS